MVCVYPTEPNLAKFVELTADVLKKFLEGFIALRVLVHRMIIMENRSVDPDNIQGSHRLISFMRIKYITRANDLP